MSVGIFIRSYDSDAEWLDLCLTSIERNVSGHDELVVVGDGRTDRRVREVCKEHGVRCESDDSFEIPFGYIAQQYSKLRATDHISSDYILYLDSDSISVSPYTPDLFLENGKPIMLWDKWEDVGQAKDAWLGCTTQLYGSAPPYEFMRRLPLVYPARVIDSCVEHLEKMHKQSLLALMRRTKRISEYNVLGMHSWTEFRGEFAWKNGRENAVELPVKQFWSHGEYDKAKAEYYERNPK